MLNAFVRNQLNPIGFYKSGRPIYPIQGGSEGAPEGGNDQGGQGGQGGPGTGSGKEPGPDGFPLDTPVAEMAPEQQVAYWKHKARKHENTAKSREDYDAIKAERDRLRQQSMTESEKAVEEAKQAALAEGRTAALSDIGAKVIDAHMSALVSVERITQEQADWVLDTIDRSKIIRDGDVDTDKLHDIVQKFFPAGNGGGGRDPHQGRGRQQQLQTSAAEQGKAEAARRFQNRNQSTR